MRSNQAWKSGQEERHSYENTAYSIQHRGYIDTLCYSKTMTQILLGAVSRDTTKTWYT